MEFVLNEYHGQVSDEELLEDMVRVANELKNNKLTCSEYQKQGKYHFSTIIKRFGSWNNALQLCNLTPSLVFKSSVRKKGQYMQSVTSNELIEDIKEVAKRIGKDTISSTEYDKYGQFCADTCRRRFGSWSNALVEANLMPYVYHSDKRIDDTLILEEIERLWVELGRQPTTNDIRNGKSKYTLNTYTRHFGGWRKALEAFVLWVNNDEQARENNDETLEPDVNMSCVEERKIEHKTPRDINLRLRFRVMNRDNFKCCICGRSPAKDPSVELHIDHIVPWSKGGETTFDNLRTLCSKCNLGKSDLTE